MAYGRGVPEKGRQARRRKTSRYWPAAILVQAKIIQIPPNDRGRLIAPAAGLNSIVAVASGGHEQSEGTDTRHWLTFTIRQGALSVLRHSFTPMMMSPPLGTLGRSLAPRSGGPRPWRKKLKPRPKPTVSVHAGANWQIRGQTEPSPPICSSESCSAASPSGACSWVGRRLHRRSPRSAGHE